MQKIYLNLLIIITIIAAFLSIASCSGTSSVDMPSSETKDGIVNTSEDIDNKIDQSEDDGTDNSAGDGDGDGDIDINDFDLDTILNDLDNCPEIFNQDQLNLDDDEFGDACDNDLDGDSHDNSIDNCELVPNPNQEDQDEDGTGDLCEDDLDGDTIHNNNDNCPDVFNQDQLNLDGDELGNACDDDDDNDGVLDGSDNCPLDANSDQANNDSDSSGDICDDDDDNDGVNDNHPDNCLFTANPDQNDTDSDGQGDECDTDIDNDSLSNNDETSTYGTDPLDPDTDDDGLTDGEEIIGDTDPNNPDCDDDGILDGDDNNPLSPDMPISVSLCISDEYINNWDNNSSNNSSNKTFATKLRFRRALGYAVYVIEVLKGRTGPEIQYYYIGGTQNTWKTVKQLSRPAGDVITSFESESLDSNDFEAHAANGYYKFNTTSEWVNIWISNFRLDSKDNLVSGNKTLADSDNNIKIRVKGAYMDSSAYSETEWSTTIGPLTPADMQDCWSE
ncbi:MAG: thrombospondin type 3 repeat-containing protein [Pseudomonadota bacterium]